MKLHICLLTIFLVGCATSPFDETLQEHLTFDETLQEHLTLDDKNNIEQDITTNDFEIFDDINLVKSSDIYHSITVESDKSFLDVPFEELKEFNKLMHENFEFLEISTQFLTFNGVYTGDAKFSEYGVINEEISDIGIHTKLKTLIIGQNLYKNLDAYIIEGRNFVAEDFVMSDESQVIHILLGYDYQGVYEIGDILNLSLIDKPLQLQVVGFLSENAKLHIEYYDSYNGQKLFENRQEFSTAIILPFYDIVYDMPENNMHYQHVYYEFKNNGFIKMSNDDIYDDKLMENIENLQKQVSEYAENKNFYCVTYQTPIRFSGIALNTDIV